MRVGGPPGGDGVELQVEISTDVEISRARSSEQPLDGTASREVEVKRGHVERHDASGLVEVRDDVSTDLMGSLRDGGKILQVGAAEGDV